MGAVEDVGNVVGGVVDMLNGTGAVKAGRRPRRGHRRTPQRRAAGRPGRWAG